MAELEKIEKISKIGKADKSAGTPGIDEIQEPARVPPNKEHFDSLVNAKPEEKVTAIESDTQGKSSIMDEVRNLNQKVDLISKTTSKDVAAQANEAITRIEGIKEKLSSPNLTLQPSLQTILHNKLSHIDENLRVALSKAGLEYNPAEHLENKAVNPIERFLGFLTYSQAQLGSISSEIESMHLNNKEISPANMLRIQMKVGYISQEIEFFSATLNKALDSTKTIMNVQV